MTCGWSRDVTGSWWRRIMAMKLAHWRMPWTASTRKVPPTAWARRVGWGVGWRMLEGLGHRVKVLGGANEFTDSLGKQPRYWCYPDTFKNYAKLILDTKLVICFGTFEHDQLDWSVGGDDGGRPACCGDDSEAYGKIHGRRWCVDGMIGLFFMAPHLVMPNLKVNKVNKV